VLIHTTILDLSETNLSLVAANHTQQQWEVLPIPQVTART